MGVDPSTRRNLDDHLGQAEFALKVAANFECLRGTPAHEAVRAALAEVATARTWVGTRLQTTQPFAGPVVPAYASVAERRRIVHRRMAGMKP
jgi:hypothetical protein